MKWILLPQDAREFPQSQNRKERGGFGCWLSLLFPSHSPFCLATFMEMPNISAPVARACVWRAYLAKYIISAETSSFFSSSFLNLPSLLKNHSNAISGKNSEEELFVPETPKGKKVFCRIVNSTRIDRIGNLLLRIRFAID